MDDNLYPLLSQAVKSNALTEYDCKIYKIVYEAENRLVDMSASPSSYINNLKFLNLYEKIAEDFHISTAHLLKRLNQIEDTLTFIADNFYRFDKPSNYSPNLPMESGQQEYE